MIQLTAPTAVRTTDLQYDATLLQTLPCGLFRAPLDEAQNLLPELRALYNTAPVPFEDWAKWELDIKIHMLMPGQYPCIPNWHCDNVPRIDGKLCYDKADPDVPMYIWISSGPETEFLQRPHECFTPTDHGQLRELIGWMGTPRFRLQPQTWYRFDQLSPHRGHAATENCWRIFARLTPREIAPGRPVISKIRRHAQVYLPSDFHW